MEHYNQHKNRDLHPFSMLILSMLTIIVAGFLFQLIGAVTASALFNISIIEIVDLQGIVTADQIGALKWLQIVGALGAFVFGSFFLSFIYTGSWYGYFDFGKRIDARAVIILVMIMLSALPFVNWLTEWNMNLQLPFEKLERYFRNMHEQTEALMMTLVGADNFWDLLLNFFMIAIIPAVGEELVFRGLIQKHFQTWLRNGHLAIVLTSVIFSLVHFQIYSFMPRFFLGLLLGYMMYYSSSIWYPMLAHLVNNGLGVLFYYFQQDQQESGVLDKLGTVEMLPLTALISALVTCGLLYIWVKGFITNRFPQSG